VVLLLVATASQGAFAISRWTPLTLFVLAVLIAAVGLHGRLNVSSRWTRAALAGIWGLAIWSLASMVWAHAPDSAFVAGSQLVLYAGIFTLPFLLPLSRRVLAAVGWALSAGVGVIALYILVRMLLGDSNLFLAGRLNGPINYRNATALLFALPVWPYLAAIANRRASRLLRAAAFGLAGLCLSLSFLTQSRGILLGLALGAVVTLALGPDRVRRAYVAGLLVVLVAAAAHWLLRPFHAFDGGHGYVTSADIAVAARAAGLVTLVAFVLGFSFALLDSGLRAHTAAVKWLRAIARALLAAIVVGAVAGGLVAMGNPATFLQHKWHQFHNLNAATPTSTRYASVGGQRYDLWRVAMKEFDSAPLIGVGADNYSAGYYRYRSTNRNLDDPHSLVFSLLSEEGLVGTGLFAVFLAGIVGVLCVGWPRLDPQSRRHAVGPIATGAVLLGQSAVDWIWRIPGLTAVGLLALSIGTAQVALASAPAAQPESGPEAETRAGRPAPVVARAGLAAGLVVLAAGVVLLFVSDAYIREARSLIYRPPAELAAARTASALDPWAVTPHYLESSAEETMGNRPAAHRQLLAALRIDPTDFASLGVLGDFEARGGDLALARAYYRRALRLNPLDTGLQQLARIRVRRTGDR
jgi:tetratricopeptide (TPR) repeat protein